MDVDPPNLCPNLKRSSSAPMINELVSTSTNSSNSIQSRGSTSTTQRLSRAIPARRFSGSFSPSRSPNSPTAPLSPLVLSRVVQIKHEESMDIVFREAAHERETKSKLQMSHSLEDLILDEPPTFTEQNRQQRSQSVADPLRIYTQHAGICGSPSPTNTGRQCFSPSTCLPVQHSAFSSTPSPSPTRKSFTRCSQSPISLRPSQLSLKRKFDMESDDGEFLPNAKHQNTGMSPIDSSPSQHHVQNLSFNSMDTSCGPSMTNDNQPSSVVGNVISVCGNSFYGTFKHLDPAPSEGLNK